MALSTNFYGSSTNKGIGGLMSGLDTDDLVKQMTQATRNKINRQYQSKQKLLYRQEAYREVSTKLLAFSNKYFSFSSGSKTNILSSKFFEANTFKSSSNYVNVTGNAENIKNFSIDNINSVATAASFTSTKTVTNGTFVADDLSLFVSPLAGETMTLEFEGESYDIKIDNAFGKDEKATIQGIVDELNIQIGKLKDKEGQPLNLKYDVDKDNNIVFKTGTAKLTAASSKVTELLNFKVGQDAISTGKIDDSKLFKTAESIFSNKDEYITFEYNGVLKKINLKDGLTDATKFTEYINAELESAFGKDKFDIKYEDGVISFAAKGTNNIFGISSISKDLSSLTGLESGDYNRVHKTKSIAELGLKDLVVADLDNGKKGFILDVNGEKIEIESTMTVTDVINKINSNAKAGVKVYYSSTTDTFTVKATEAGAHKSVSISDVSGKGNLASALFGTAGSDYTIKDGTDTEMTYTLNGVQNTITRSTANFSVDEINIELNEKASTIDFSNKVTFDVINNSEEVVEKVKKFIEEYNEIISLIGTKVSEKPKRDYLPLTPEQQEDMEEEEIKNWNIEAQKGALYGDRKMNNVLRSLRESMSGLTDVSELTLSAIGISAATMDTSGKLVFDEKKFREKLIENPDQIAALFTNTSSKTGNDAKSGISLQLQKILRENVGTYGTTGLLIDEAGMPNSMTSDKNFISEKITEYDKKMAELKKDLEAERKRYWDQFTALEKSMSRLNTQSSWLTDMMGQ